MIEEKPVQPETPELPISPQEVQIQSPSFLDKLKTHKSKILAGILGVLVFTGAVFGAYKLGQRQARPSPQPTPTPIVVATPTPDPTANWKTYTNTGQKWVLRYPSNWEMEEIVDGSVIFRAPGTDYQEPTLKVVTGAEVRVSLLPWEYSGDISSLEEEVGPVPESDVTIVAVERITVAGQTAVKTISESVDGRAISVSIPRGTEVFQITFRSPEESYHDTFNLMLSTFKFLEDSAKGEPCGGIAGKLCPAGYRCKYVCPEGGSEQACGSMPDAYGHCVKADEKFTCPPPGTLDCMPGPDRPELKYCTSEYSAWIEANCSGVQIVW